MHDFDPFFTGKYEGSFGSLCIDFHVDYLPNTKKYLYAVRIENNLDFEALDSLGGEARYDAVTGITDRVMGAVSNPDDPETGGFTVDHCPGYIRIGWGDLIIKLLPRHIVQVASI